MTRAVHLLLATSVALAACGPKPSPAPVPVLPGDGDEHTAKPSPPPAPEAKDAWAGKHRPDLTARAQAAREGRPAEDRGLQALQRARRSSSSRAIGCRSSRCSSRSRRAAMHEPRARLGVSEFDRRHARQGHEEARRARHREGDRLRRRHDRRRLDVRGDAGLVQRARPQHEHVPRARARDDHAADVPRGRAREGHASSSSARSASASTTPGTLASAHVQNLLWGNDHVRGWINSETSIAAIKREDLIAWHKTWFVPGNAMLVVTGDVDVKKLKGDLERSFGRWAKGPVPPAPSYKEPGTLGEPDPPRRQAGPDPDPHPHRAVRHQARRPAVLRHARVELHARRRRVQLATDEGRARRGRQDLRRELELRSQPRQGLVRRVDVHAQQRGGRDDEADPRRDREDGRRTVRRRTRSPRRSRTSRAATACASSPRPTSARR